LSAEFENVVVLGDEFYQELISHPVPNDLFGGFGFANQIGTTEYSRPRRFRAMIELWLGSIRALWPHCPARISTDGQTIVLNRSLAVFPREVWNREPGL
jgi:hypothetical protein